MTHQITLVGDLHLPVRRDLPPSAGKTSSLLPLLMEEMRWKRDERPALNLTNVATKAMNVTPDAPASLPHVTITDTVGSTVPRKGLA